MTTDIVTTLEDDGSAGSLRLLLVSGTGDLVTFAPGLSGGTITLAGPLVVSRNVTVEGLDNGVFMVLDGDNSTMILDVKGGTVTLNNLGLRNGRGEGSDAQLGEVEAKPGVGGILMEAGVLTLNNVTLATDFGFGGRGADGAPGADGGAGGYAAGGILVLGGSVSLNAVNLLGNKGYGGAGGSGDGAGIGGHGGYAAGGILLHGGSLSIHGSSALYNYGKGGDGGAGGSGDAALVPGPGGGGRGGGFGGQAAGGLFTMSGGAGIGGSAFSGDTGVGGYGGYGGFGGSGRDAGNAYVPPGGNFGAHGKPGQAGGNGTHYGPGGGVGGSGGSVGQVGGMGGSGMATGGDGGGAGGGGGGGGGGVGVAEFGGSQPTTLPCFVAGTRIRTPGGEVAVEALRVGDLVCSHFGGTAPVRWIGQRRVACDRHPRPQDVWPVLVQRNAFAPGQPARDLYLSPDHAIFDPESVLLVPVRYLVNGASIRQVAREAVTYFHVELPAHDVLLAEGLPAESFLDTGNRDSFEGRAMRLHADFALQVWASESCARLLVGGPELAELRARLIARAAALGHVPAGSPGLHLLAGERVILPQEIDGNWRFVLPADCRPVRLRSNRAVPAEIAAEGSDHRRLGVAVALLLLDGCEVALDDPRLGGGWHEVEADAGWRWTDGDSTLLPGGAAVLELRVAMAPLAWARTG